MVPNFFLHLVPGIKLGGWYIYFSNLVSKLLPTFWYRSGQYLTMLTPFPGQCFVERDYREPYGLGQGLPIGGEIGVFVDILAKHNKQF